LRLREFKKSGHTKNFVTIVQSSYNNTSTRVAEASACT